MWARLYDSEEFYGNILRLLGNSTNPNMLDNHPPFVSKEAVVLTVEIAEALLQCTGGEIILLPALPKEWPEGSIKGLRAKGGITVNLRWSEGKLTAAELIPDHDIECRVRIGEEIRTILLTAGEKFMTQ